MTTQTVSPPVARLLAAVADKARAAGVFADVRIDGPALHAPAKDSAEPAEYRLFVESEPGGQILWVALVTEHRWLSQSIEADLVHTGDKIEDLLAEELVDLGWEHYRPSCEHFRDARKLYTFRTPLPLDLARADSSEVVEKAATALLAYEQCFRALGDMEADDEE
jgi:hypothetical protein